MDEINKNHSSSLTYSSPLPPSLVHPPTLSTSLSSTLSPNLTSTSSSNPSSASKTLYLVQDNSHSLDPTGVAGMGVTGVGVTSGVGGIKPQLVKIPSIDTIPGQQYSIPYSVPVTEEFYPNPFQSPGDPSLPGGLSSQTRPGESLYQIPSAQKFPSFKSPDFHTAVRQLPSIKSDPVSAPRVNNGPTLGQLAVKFQSYAATDSLKHDDLMDGEGDDDEEGGDTSVCIQGAEHTGRWTKKEHELFLEALKKHGKEWKKVAAMVKTRTVVQTRTHAQKYFQKVQKYIFPEQQNEGTDVNLGGHSVETSHPMNPSIQRVNSQPAHLNPSSTYLNTAMLQQNKKMKIDPETILAVAGTQSLLPPSSLASLPTAIPSLTGSSTTSVSNPENDDDYFYCENEQKPSGLLPSHQSPIQLSGRYLPNKDIPPPSPASCGKRKNVEVAVAQALTGTALSPIDMQSGVQTLTKMKTATVLRNRPPPRSTRPSNGIGLSIINPDTLPSFRSEDEPNTPWDCDMKELETKQRSSALHVAVQTTLEQNEFIRQVCESALNGDVESLLKLLQSARFSDSSETSISQDISRAKTPNAENDHQTPSTSSMAPPTSTPNQKIEARSNLVTEMLNRVNDNDESVLMKVCSRRPSAQSPTLLTQANLLEICKILIEYGASVTLVNSKLQTCLHLVAIEGYDMIAHHLILKGCPVNALDNNGDTAAHLATRNGHLSVLQVLTNCGANFHIRNNSWRCPLDLASDCPDLHISRLDVRRSLLTMEPRLRSLVLYHEDCLEHAARRESDWEGPDRLRGIMNLIMDNSVFPSYQLEISNQFPKAPVEMLSRVHSAEYIAFVNTLSKKVQETGNTADSSNIVPFTPHVQKSVMKQDSTEIKHPDGCDTSFSPGTLKAARRAAGAVAHAVDRVLLCRNRNAFCVVRPPGHHAGYNGLLDGAKSCGFCIFNSVAAGALHALEAHNCERVAIIDIDVHHGNGTEDIVRRYQHPSRLFFFSVHLFEKDDPPSLYEFFPGSGREDDTTHNIINVPIPPMWQEPGQSHGTRSAKTTSNGPRYGRDAFKQAILQRLIPALRAFSPDLILLSTGFDPAIGDVGNSKHDPTGPIAGMNLRPIDFEWVTMELVKVADICCNGRLVSVLEGGYGTYPNSSSASKATKEKSKGGGYLDRSILSEAAGAHLRRLIDPYGYVDPDPSI